MENNSSKINYKKLFNNKIPYIISIPIIIFFLSLISLLVYLTFQDSHLRLISNKTPNIGNNISYPISNTTNIEDNSIEGTIKTFYSLQGYFSIDLPSTITMTEQAESMDYGYISGDTVFTFGEYISPQEGQLTPGMFVISYGKPQITAKGGACTSGYVSEIIAAQNVEVCEGDGFFGASYFTNPNREIEYKIDTLNLTSEQVKLISNAVRETLRFL